MKLAGQVRGFRAFSVLLFPTWFCFFLVLSEVHFDMIIILHLHTDLMSVKFSII